MESCVFFVVEHSFLSVGCARNKLSVSHSSTESEIVSSRCWIANGWITCSRLVERGDRSVTLIEQYQTTNSSSSRKLMINCRTWTTSPQTQILLRASLSCTFLKTMMQKKITKGRSPTMRHVSRSHRVARDRLFVRIHLDPQIQIKYVHTKNQLADMLTKGSFTRDAWDHLLLLLPIMNFSMASCSHFLSNRKQSVMFKRAQESTSQEGWAVAKPKPMTLVPRNLLSAKKTPPQDSSASNSPGNQELDRSYVSPSVRKLMRNSNQDPTSYSQERQQDDTQSSSHRKLGRSGESASSASTRKLERGEDIQNREDNFRISQHAELRPSIA